jgi:small-conductance mechanosensitive channel
MSKVPLREHFDSEVASVRRELGSLKELLESKTEASTEAAKLALSSADKASSKADTNFEKRMDQTNEWRGALDDVMKRLATIQQFDALKERVEANEKKLDAMLNKVIGFGVLITFIVGIIAIVFAVTGR